MDVAFIVVASLFIYVLLVENYSSQLRHSKGMMYGLMLYHYVFFGVYYLAFNGGVDAKRYFGETSRFVGNWLSSFDIGTEFIVFVAYPFIRIFNLGYEATMIGFAFFGLVGIFYFYLTLLDVLKYRHKLFGIDLIGLFVFLPNIHVWSVSLGKGSVILMGLGLLFYGLVKPRERARTLLLGGIIVFCVRPHILAVCLAGMVMASIVSSRLSFIQRIFGSLIALGVFAIIASVFLEDIGLQEADFDSINQFVDSRAESLSAAGSGVDISNYNQPMKIFTFLYRPLFVDSPSAFGLLASFENLFYLLLTVKVFFHRRIIGFFKRTSWFVKVCFFTFLLTSVAMAQIMSNLGIATRQKAQYYFLFLIVVLAFADYMYDRYRKVLFGE
jgi:hypothetical protein